MLNADIATSLQRATGLVLTPETVARAVAQRMRQCGLAELDAYLALLHPGGKEWSALTDLVVVPETWFFRDREAFRVAVQYARELLAGGRRRVTILHVPCATGEEPYSLAMSLLDAGFDAADFRIEAIDISGRALEHAARGVYGSNAFRTADLAFRDRHFTRAEHGYELHRRVRDCVAFSQENVLKMDLAARTERYDIVFCRNLLIYFDEATQREAVSRLAAMLRDDGMLFAGYAEVPVFHQHRFASTGHAMAFGLKKAIAAEARAPVVPQALASIVHVSAAVPTRRRPVPAHPAAAPRPRLPSAAGKPDSGALLEQARLLADQGDFRTAGARLVEYLRHKPDCVEANLLFGLVSDRNGDLRTAESHVKRAVYLDPQHYQALCHLALLAEKQGNAAGASAVRERAARVFQRQQHTPDNKGQRGR